MSSVRLLATGSACSEMTENGCEVERVGAGAVPQARSVNRRIAMIAVLSIHHSPESSPKNHCVTPSSASQLLGAQSWERRHPACLFLHKRQAGRDACAPGR